MRKPVPGREAEVRRQSQKHLQKLLRPLKGRTEEQEKRKRSQEVAVETLSDARSALKDVFESVEFRRLARVGLLRHGLVVTYLNHM